MAILPSVDAPPNKKQREPQRQQPLQTSNEEHVHKKTVDRGYQDMPAAFKNVNAKLPQPYGVMMRDILRHLQDTGAKLNDGTDVTDKTKVVLWLLENADIV